MMAVKKQYHCEVYKFTDTKEKAMDAILFKIEQEGEIHKKTMLQKYISPPQIVQQYAALETFKLSDAMTIKFGFGMDQLMVAVEQFAMQADPKFKSLNQLAFSQRNANEQKFVDDCSPAANVKSCYLVDSK